MTADDRKRAILAPLLEAIQREERDGVIGVATRNAQRAVTAAFEDALVGALVESGILTQEEWESAFLRELQVKVSAVLAAVKDARRAA